MYKWLLLGHVVGGAMLFGGHVYVESLAAAAGRAKDDIGYMTVMMRGGEAANRVMGVASVLTIVFGVWLVLDSAAFEFEDLFISIGLLAVGCQKDPPARAVIAAQVLHLRRDH